MGHNKIYRGGATLDEAIRQGATHLRVACLDPRCKREQKLILGDLTLQRNVPLNHFAWKCERMKGGCGGNNISVSLITPEGVEIPTPLMELEGIKPRGRRWPGR